MSDTATAPVARRVRIKPYDIEAGPLGHLQAERERLAGLTWQHLDAAPMGATINRIEARPRAPVVTALLAFPRAKEPGRAWRKTSDGPSPSCSRETKRCCICGLVKPLTDCHRKKSASDGLQS